MTARFVFPDPRSADKDGLLAVGGNLEPQTLEQAYRHGIFPWPHPGYPLMWFSPDPRGVLDFQEFHIPTSMQKWIKTIEKKMLDLKITQNQAFRQVMENCRLQKRPFQHGTWILPEMVESYVRMQKLGLARSLEIWEANELVGGIYGVDIKGIFSGESMFFKKKNMSKFALVKLVETLQNEGRTWIDIQMVTPVLASFGGKYISRELFLKRLE